MNLVINLVILLVVTFCVFQSEARPQSPRRDEQYPPRDVLAEYKNIADKCKAETGTTAEIVKEFSDGDHLTPVEDEALKCYMNCIFHKIEVVDDTGHVHMEKLRLKVPDNLKDIGHNMLDNCQNPVGENLCEKAYWLHKCFKQVDPVHYFLM